MEPTQPPVQWIQGAVSLGVNLPGRKTDRSSPSSAKVKNFGAIPPLPHTSSCRYAKLIKNRDRFYVLPLLFFHWHYSPSGRRPTSMKLSVSLRLFSES
jgi:hypothetical protein